jgi:hypothetical protein
MFKEKVARLPTTRRREREERSERREADVRQKRQDNKRTIGDSCPTLSTVIVSRDKTL